jgi:hypothetical protein
VHGVVLHTIIRELSESHTTTPLHLVSAENFAPPLHLVSAAVLELSDVLTIFLMWLVWCEVSSRHAENTLPEEVRSWKASCDCSSLR